MSSLLPAVMLKIQGLLRLQKMVFRFAIVKFDLKTPGREDDDVEAEKKVVLSNDNYTQVASIILEGLGGRPPLC